MYNVTVANILMYKLPQISKISAHACRAACTVAQIARKSHRFSSYLQWIDSVRINLYDSSQIFYFPSEMMNILSHTWKVFLYVYLDNSGPQTFELSQAICAWRSHCRLRKSNLQALLSPPRQSFFPQMPSPLLPSADPARAKLRKGQRATEFGCKQIEIMASFSFVVDTTGRHADLHSEDSVPILQ